MGKYVSLLRGINVSGQKKIKMVDLKAMYEEIGFTNVQTYIQSGNVLFSTRKKSTKNIRKVIMEKIKEVYDFEVAVMIKTEEELSWAIDNHPFISEDEAQLKKVAVVFLEKVPDPMVTSELLNHVEDWPEEIKIEKDIVFLHAVNGFGRTKLTNNLLERKLKLAATSRNWRTVNVLFGMFK